MRLSRRRHAEDDTEDEAARPDAENAAEVTEAEDEPAEDDDGQDGQDEGADAGSVPESSDEADIKAMKARLKAAKAEMKAAKKKAAKRERASWRAPAATARWDRRSGIATLGGLGLAAAILLALGTYVLVQENRITSADSEAQEAKSVAERVVVDASSYDYRTLESDFQAAASNMTGDLREEFEQTAEQIGPTAKEQEAVSQTTVLKAGVEEVSGDRVRVLVYANRLAQSKEDERQRLPEEMRVLLTMVKEDGRWVASEIQVL